ncbi:MAG: hypothetical protein D6718_05315 [Acidobacteria bacterium]|nr:MAG: hypothetical protein D6718_05315 [Acidobacteriota bacterium]
MADRSWLSRLTGGGEPPRAAGTPALLTGYETLARASALVSETLVTGGAAFAGIPGRRHHDDAAGAVAAARGLAATGHRAAALVAPERIEPLAEQLTLAASRLEPVLVLLVLPEGHEGGAHAAYHALAPTGALLAQASSLQELADLAVVLRAVAERSLFPAVLAIDPPLARAVQDVRLAPADAVERFLGDPADRVEPQDPAQSIVFGESRRRVVRWFDPDAPVGRGLLPGSGERAAVLAGRRAFHAERLPATIDDVLAEWAAQTGRPLGLLAEHRLHGAEFVILTHGSFFEPACAAATRLRREGARHVGVLGMPFLRPLPGEALRFALAEAKTVTVLEAADDPLAGATPLAQLLRAVLRESATRVLSAVGGLGFPPAGAAEIEALFSEMMRENPRPIVYLGVRPPSAGSAFPKREALLHRVARECPGAERVALLPPPEAPAGAPAVRGVALAARTRDVPSDALERLGAAAAGGAAEVCVRARAGEAVPGVWIGRALAAPEPFEDPGDDAAVDLVLVAGFDLPAGAEPLRLAARRGRAVIAASEDPAEVWRRLPGSWADAVRERELDLFVWRGSPAEMAAIAGPLLAGEAADLEPVDWYSLPEPMREPAEADLPELVRRFQRIDARHDNLPRFWSEQVEPTLAGGEPPSVDPYLTAGSVPAYSAALAEVAGRAAALPLLDAERCTGCGVCWTACPDGALAPAAVPTESLLDTAARQAAEEGAFDPESEGGRRLARLQKPIAGRLDGAVARAGSRAVPAGTARKAVDEVLAKAGVEGPASEELARAAGAVAERLERLPLVAGEALFHAPHKARKGSGRLLLLALDARSCTGCGVCAAECPEEALSLEPRTPERLEEAKFRWRLWERLPDTAGETIARVAESLGPLPAIQLSRHALAAVRGDAGREAGSGGKLAVRLVLTVAESLRQKEMVETRRRLEELGERLRERVREAMVAPVEIDDLELLERVLDGAPPRRTETRELLERIERLGKPASTDVPRLKALLAAAREIASIGAALEAGFGRSRYGLVIADEATAEWAARFPRHPFGAPLVVDLSERALDLAAGLAEGLLERAVAEARAIRRAEVLAQAPADAPRRLREIERLTWRDLTDEERGLFSPVLFVARAVELNEGILAGLSRALASDLPLVVLLLDDRDLLAEAADPALFALAHREAYVASTSPAAFGHLYDAVAGALAAKGPAVLHLHAPSPARHGFPAERLLERARDAIACRVHPLLRYDPSGEGVFGLRLSLEGNPDPERALPEEAEARGLTAESWCASEERYARHLEGGPSPELQRAIARTREIWATLQELAGLVTPFTAAVRERAEREVAEAHRAEIDRLRREYEAKLASAAAEADRRHRAMLRERLLQLAGAAGGGNGRIGR